MTFDPWPVALSLGTIRVCAPCATRSCRGGGLFGLAKTTFKTRWQGGELLLTVKCHLSDRRVFERDLGLIAECARTFEQVSRDLNDLAQENGLVLGLDPRAAANIRAEMRPS